MESVCYQTRDIVEVMARDAGVRLKDLRVDGGMTQNNLLLQLQSDILGIPISNVQAFKAFQYFLCFFIVNSSTQHDRINCLGSCYRRRQR